MQRLLTAPCFNSSMVRFGVFRKRKTCCFRFVSIPVWCDLEEVRKVYFNKPQRSFNSSMVRFGETKQACFLLRHKSFNSSMVRFGDPSVSSNWIPVSGFQFQYGAIWRARPACLTGTTNSVSIPVWCDLETEAQAIDYIFSSFNSSMVRFGAFYVFLKLFLDF